MIKKFFLLNIILVFFISCGFESLYVKQNQSLIKISSIDTKGDEKINKKILSLLVIDVSEDKTGSYILVIDSKTKREIIAKDSTGKATSYKISMKIYVSLTDAIDKDKVIKSKEFTSSFTYNNSENKFQLSQDEKNILNNLIESATSKIVIYINS